MYAIPDHGKLPFHHSLYLHFLQLPKGDYKLRIRKYIVKGPFPEISINIHVKPAWYSSFWAYTAYFLLLYLLLFIGICYHFRKAKRKERLNTEKKQKEEEENRRRIRHELLQKELEDKQNELARQTSSLVKKSQALQELLEEFERQKEQLGDRYPNLFFVSAKTGEGVESLFASAASEALQRAGKRETSTGVDVSETKKDKSSCC